MTDHSTRELLLAAQRRITELEGVIRDALITLKHGNRIEAGSHVHDQMRTAVAGVQPSQASSRDVLYDEIDPNTHDEIPRALGWREAITPTRLTSPGGAPAACEAAAASFRPVPRLWKARTQGEDASRCGVAASSSHAQCAQCGAPDRPARLLEHPWLNELSAPERPCGVSGSDGKTFSPAGVE